MVRSIVIKLFSCGNNHNVEVTIAIGINAHYCMAIFTLPCRVQASQNPSIPPSLPAVVNAAPGPTNVLSNTRRIGVKHTIQLIKGQNGLGFGITSRDVSTNSQSPIYVKSINADSPASKDGHLKIGDRLLEVCVCVCVCVCRVCVCVCVCVSCVCVSCVCVSVVCVCVCVSCVCVCLSCVYVCSFMCE